VVGGIAAGEIAAVVAVEVDRGRRQRRIEVVADDAGTQRGEVEALAAVAGVGQGEHQLFGRCARRYLDGRAGERQHGIESLGDLNGAGVRVGGNGRGADRITDLRRVLDARAGGG